MAIIYENVEPTLIENTTIRKMISNGVDRAYLIEANDGYVLHDNRCDLEPDGVTVLETVELFATGTISVSINYDFNNTTIGTYEGVDGVTYNVTKIGAYELYTLPASAVDVANTYGGVTPPTVTEYF